MPVLRQDHMLKIRSQRIHARHNRIAFRYRKRPTRAKIILEINDEQSICIAYFQSCLQVQAG
jgi:hypothetical protein